MMSIYKRHRFSPDIISYAVWLYHRFNLSCRDVENLLAERGISVSYELAPHEQSLSSDSESQAASSNR